ncbi:hypothetical protein SAMN06295912_11135 [Sphingomonas laterariae]|uniref:Uncharacterized protein n=2 Tax=Edaphosphingomonas laterariae TaxID=861865 RepID=A0A239G525_9SPHN|nr:hypothetical protein SAMN06295912_11135 [Sphingomonas laterariae]
MQRDFRNDAARPSSTIAGWISSLIGNVTDTFEPLHRAYFDAPWHRENRDGCARRS